ncbi:unnamed protein product, partial [Iphiclides podalirius]
MRRLALLITFATVCLASCPDKGIGGYRNSEWMANSVVVKLFNFFYDSIALTSGDTCSPEKRFVSIFTLVKTIFLTTNSTDVGTAVSIAKAKAAKQLKNSAAALAGTFRGAVNRILTIIDQPINDVLTSCPPDEYQEECQATLRDYHNRNERLCNGYYKNVALYNSISKWANSQESIDYIDDIVKMSKNKNNDTAVLDYFGKIATSKYNSTFKELRRIVTQVKSGTFNCNILSFVNSQCA